MTIREKREALLKDNDLFTRFFIRVIEGNYEETKLDAIFNKTLQEVINLKRNKLIINIPTGVGKTMRICGFIIRGFLINHASRFLFITKSEQNAKAFGRMIRTFINSEPFKYLFPEIGITSDVSAKHAFLIEKEGSSEYGAFLAFSTKSQEITGNRAGRASYTVLNDDDTLNTELSLFSGCLIVDDMLDATASMSKIEVENAVNILINTLSSRLATNYTPIIIIAQRLGAYDVQECLLEHFEGEAEKNQIKYRPEFDRLRVPMFLKREEEDYEEDRYNEIQHNITLDGSSIWNTRMTKEQGDFERKFKPNKYYPQLQQVLLKSDGTYLKADMISLFSWEDWLNMDVKINRSIIVLDTASKTKDVNDNSVFNWCGWCSNNQKLFIFGSNVDKLEFGDLNKEFISFFKRCVQFSNKNPSLQIPIPTKILIEDASSGIALNQELKKTKLKNLVQSVTPRGAKNERINAKSPFLKYNYIAMANNNKNLEHLRKEFRRYNPKSNDNLDDFLDTIIMSLNEFENEIEQDLVNAKEVLGYYL